MRRMCSENGLTKKQLSLYLEKMKTIRYHIIAGAMALLATGCNDDGINAGQNPAKTGDEVQFGLSLPGKDSRTIYGDENTDDKGNKSFPIYWVNGDLVKVASPQCLTGRNVAEYQVNVDGTEQNYATSMTRTGEFGVQWGEADAADFYSIYPSNAGTELRVNGENVTAKLHVDATQFARTTSYNDYFYAQPAEMGNVVMYAKTTRVTKAENAVVELNYIPFSTVLEFEINAPTQNTGSEKSEITIQSLTLTAPTGTTIAGDFGFTFPASADGSPSIEAATGGSNAITMHFLDNNQYTTVLSTTKPQLKAKMCLMPISGVKSLSGWTVAVNTSAGTFSKTIKDSDLTDKNTALAPGKVHKIKLPALSYASQEWVYSLDNWIPTLPDYTNIYLSEVSLPGAWYAGSDEPYQATPHITTLWNNGVRAFAVECRTNSEWINTGTFFRPDYKWVPQNICISGTGRNPAIGSGYAEGTNITTVIDTIKTNLAKHPNEYAVLVLSYADGGEGGHRDEDHAFFLKGIASALSGYSDIIYDKAITANTTINDVKGKLIVKVNVDSNIPIGDYQGMNALLSYNPFLSQMSGADYSKPYYSNLYWNGWSDDRKSYDLVNNLETSTDNANKFIWVFSSANRTQVNTGTNTTIPTYTQRQTALGAMGTYSKRIYDASTHNVWFYFNCGGTQATSSTSDGPSPTDFASTMNPWLLERINAKTDASPLGIVMFNQCTNDTYNGPAIVKAIIEMNSKFYLKHAGVSGGTTPTAQNNSTFNFGGSAF